MSPKVGSLSSIPETQVFLERQVDVASLPAVEYCGIIAIMHSQGSQRITFQSGAEGHTNAEMHLVGEYMDNTTLSGEPVERVKRGNILFIPRRDLIDTRIQLSTDTHRIPYDGRDITQAIMDSLATREVGGVRYDAVVSYAFNGRGDAQEVVYASADDVEPTRLRIPLPDELLR